MCNFFLRNPSLKDDIKIIQLAQSETKHMVFVKVCGFCPWKKRKCEECNVALKMHKNKGCAICVHLLFNLL